MSMPFNISRKHECSRLFCISFVICVCCLWAASSSHSFAAMTKRQKQELNAQKPAALKKVSVQQKLGNKIDLSLIFTDHHGKRTSLKQLFAKHKAVILTMNYYRCPQLCTFQLNGLIEVLKKIDRSLREEIAIVTVSIDPRETPVLAKRKRKNYLALFEKTKPPQWDFLVGKEPNIRSLAKATGFGYSYVRRRKEYAHKAVLFIMTSKGKISKYIGGIRFRPRDLQFALVEASAGKTGSLWTQILMSCFVYDASVGKYTPYAFGIVRLGGILTVLVLSIFLSLMWLHERRAEAEKTKV